MAEILNMALYDAYLFALCHTVHAKTPHLDLTHHHVWFRANPVLKPKREGAISEQTALGVAAVSEPFTKYLILELGLCDSM